MVTRLPRAVVVVAVAAGMTLVSIFIRYVYYLNISLLVGNELGVDVQCAVASRLRFQQLYF